MNGNVKVLSTRYRVSNETKEGRQFNIMADITMDGSTPVTFEGGSITRVENGEYVGSFYKGQGNFNQNFHSDWAFENKEAITQEISAFIEDCNTINI